jgi:hypothetical protein
LSITDYTTDDNDIWLFDRSGQVSLFEKSWYHDSKLDLNLDAATFEAGAELMTLKLEIQA